MHSGMKTSFFLYSIDSHGVINICLTPDQYTNWIQAAITNNVIGMILVSAVKAF